jgi:protein-S-isoprenylcysteine O-methyltransferase Ste14
MVLHFAQTPEKVELEQTPKYLLRRGPYTFTRNPMYLAELALWLGWALFYGSIAVFIGFLVVWVLMNFMVVPREERNLEARFGQTYLRYKNTVPRWLGKTRR